MCRQNMGEISSQVTEIAGMGLSLRGFGVKIHGLTAHGCYPESTDSVVELRSALGE